MEVEVCIIKKMFSYVTVELEGDNPSLEDLSSAVKNEIQRINDEEEWSEVAANRMKKRSPVLGRKTFI